MQIFSNLIVAINGKFWYFENKSIVLKTWFDFWELGSEEKKAMQKNKKRKKNAKKRENWTIKKGWKING